MYGDKRAYPGPNITGSNSVSLRSPRPIRPRLSVDTSRLSPEPRTPTNCNSVNSKFSQINNQYYDLGEPRIDRLNLSEASPSSFVEDALLTTSCRMQETALWTGGTYSRRNLWTRYLTSLTSRSRPRKASRLLAIQPRFPEPTSPLHQRVRHTSNLHLRVQNIFPLRQRVQLQKMDHLIL